MKIDQPSYKEKLCEMLRAAGGLPVRTTYSYKHGPEPAEDNPRDQRIEHWIIHGAVIMIVSYMENDRCIGWDVYLPANTDNRVDRTFLEVEKFLVWQNQHLRGTLPYSQER